MTTENNTKNKKRIIYEITQNIINLSLAKEVGIEWENLTENRNFILSDSHPTHGKLNKLLEIFKSQVYAE